MTTGDGGINFANTERRALRSFGNISVFIHQSALEEIVRCEFDKGMAWATPKYTRSQVDAAGKSMANDFLDVPLFGPSSYDHVLEVINNWRSSHACPLQIIKMTLLKRARKVDEHALIAQRIKRIPAIALKLRNTPSMNLSRMHDIGGCRAVVRKVHEVEKLVLLYEKATAKNARRSGEFVKKYDYITNPKSTGYRGVHLVYKYRTASTKLRIYNGLRIEIQLRSQIQHAWATAVETVDAFTAQALKSNLGEDSWKRFFALVATAFAWMEKRPMVPGTSTDIAAVKKELHGYKSEMTILEGFKAATEMLVGEEGQVFLLRLDTEKRNLNVKRFPQQAMSLAQEAYLAVEKENKGNSTVQAVLVSVDSLKALRKAYPNYFGDVTAFVNLIGSFLAQ